MLSKIFKISFSSLRGHFWRKIHPFFVQDAKLKRFRRKHPQHVDGKRVLVWCLRKNSSADFFSRNSELFRFFSQKTAVKNRENWCFGIERGVPVWKKMFEHPFGCEPEYVLSIPFGKEFRSEALPEHLFPRSISTPRLIRNSEKISQKDFLAETRHQMSLFAYYMLGSCSPDFFSFSIEQNESWTKREVFFAKNGLVLENEILKIFDSFFHRSFSMFIHPK